MIIASVSYINSYPFLFGIDSLKKKYQELDVKLWPPSVCAHNFILGTVDLALVPVGALPSIAFPYSIVSDYCIGAVSSVKTVMLFSNVSLPEIEKIYLDNESLTSAKLIKLLAKKHWHMQPEFVQIDSISDICENNGDAFLLIGDKCFEYQNRFKYAYDLFDAWYAYKKMPIVFAVWVAKKGINEAFLKEFTAALTHGLTQKSQALKKYIQNINDFDFLLNYLEKNISYTYDDDKKAALMTFLNETNCLSY